MYQSQYVSDKIGSDALQESEAKGLGKFSALEKTTHQLSEVAQPKSLYTTAIDPSSNKTIAAAFGQGSRPSSEQKDSSSTTQHPHHTRKYGLRQKDQRPLPPMSRPSDMWESTYKSSIVASTSPAALATTAKSTPAPVSTSRHRTTLPITNDLDSRLRADPAKSSYMRDFNQAPLERITSTTTQNLTLHTTTTDLLSGTVKQTGGKHVPGYMGHVPGARANSERASSTSSILTAAAKDNILQTFRPNIPGYGGYVPTNPQNDKGPRTSASKEYKMPGISTGFIVDSMKTD